MFPLEWSFLGETDYLAGLQMQRAWAEEVAAGASDRLFLLEHPPTVTLGRHADPAHLLLTAEQYAQRGISLHHVERGGDVTYHGPGQLVGYPVVSLRRVGCGPARWVEGVAAVLIDYLAGLGIDASWSAEHPGIWVGQAKIAAVGFHIARRITTHGFALNLDPALDGFETIVPCGISQGRVTSVAQLAGHAPPLAQAASALAALMAERFAWRLVPRIEAQPENRERTPCFVATP